jgi:hypothetical protein
MANKTSKTKHDGRVEDAEVVHSMDEHDAGALDCTSSTGPEKYTTQADPELPS